MALILPGVALSGFMGSGKSTVGRALAQETIPSRFVDIDEAIKKDFIQMPIGDFIGKFGMNSFRAIESQAIAEILGQNFDETFQVLSLGGGAVTIQQNVERIKKASFKLVYLDVPFDIIAQRLREDYDGNKDRVPFDEGKFWGLYNDRQEIYHGTADFVVSNMGEVEEAVEQILGKLKIAA